MLSIVRVLLIVFLEASSCFLAIFLSDFLSRAPFLLLFLRPDFFTLFDADRLEADFFDADLLSLLLEAERDLLDDFRPDRFFLDRFKKLSG